jgi:hypothetical protein
MRSLAGPVPAPLGPHSTRIFPPQSCRHHPLPIPLVPGPDHRGGTLGHSNRRNDGHETSAAVGRFALARAAGGKTLRLQGRLLQGTRTRRSAPRARRDPLAGPEPVGARLAREGSLRGALVRITTGNDSARVRSWAKRDTALRTPAERVRFPESARKALRPPIRMRPSQVRVLRR